MYALDHLQFLVEVETKKHSRNIKTVEIGTKWFKDLKTDIYVEYGIRYFIESINLTLADTFSLATIVGIINVKLNPSLGMGWYIEFYDDELIKLE